MQPARILIADLPSALPAIRQALSGYELVEVTTFELANRMLMEDGFKLVVVGIHFDDSRAIELINILRQDENHKKYASNYCPPFS